MLVITGVRKAGESQFAEKKESEKFTKDHMVVLELCQKVEGVDAEEAAILQHSVVASTFVFTVKMDGLVDEIIDENGELDLLKTYAAFRKKYINKEMKSMFGFDIPIDEITGGEFNTIKFVYAPEEMQTAQTRHIVGVGKNEELARQNAIEHEKPRLIRAQAAGIIELQNV